MNTAVARRSTLPGFGLTMGLTLTWLSVIILIPLAGLFLKTLELSPVQFWEILTSRRTLNALKISFGLSFAAACVNLVMGTIIVWALVRYRFPGRRLFDAIVDIPFALPTAVAGVALTQLFAQKGWLGAPLAELGIKVAFTPIGIFIAMVFIGIPFVVRTVQPVLIDLDREIEEAAASLGANRWHTVFRVILPSLIPALLTGLRAYASMADLAISPLSHRGANDRARAVASPKDLRTEPAPVRFVVVALAVTFLTVFVVLPLVVVFASAFSKGISAYFSALAEPEALSAIQLTLLVAAISVGLNLVFGVIAAWAIAKFEFTGKTFLITLIDLPFSVSPVISGLVFVLLFGAQGYWGTWLQAHNVHILFAVPGIALATIFVTFPFVARSLIPLMQEQGTQEEEAATSLGASGLQTFFRVTLPNIKWGLLYGVLLCNARAMGEFGAVSVVSGHIRGETNTMPLLVEILYNEYQFVASFAIASLLAMLALITLVVKTVLGQRLDEGQPQKGLSK